MAAGADLRRVIFRGPRGKEPQPPARRDRVGCGSELPALRGVLIEVASFEEKRSMPRPRWSPVYVYVAVFGAVVAWGMTRHPPIAPRANADIVKASLPSPTQG